MTTAPLDATENTQFGPCGILPEYSAHYGTIGDFLGCPSGGAAYLFGTRRAPWQWLEHPISLYKRESVAKSGWWHGVFGKWP